MVAASLRYVTLVCAVVATACAPSQVRTTAEPSPIPSPQATVQSSPSPLARLGQSPSPSPGTPDALVARASADAAERVGVPVAEVAVVSVTAREWPDASLGCPRPGVGYAQVITPGYVIVVQVRGQRLEYHTDHNQVVHCID